MAGQTNGSSPRKRGEKFMRYAMGAHGGSVYLVALAQTRSEHDAQDVAQDVFCRLLTDATTFTRDEHLRAWLLRVTVNRCREIQREVEGTDTSAQVQELMSNPPSLYTITELDGQGRPSSPGLHVLNDTKGLPLHLPFVSYARRMK